MPIRNDQAVPMVSNLMINQILKTSLHKYLNVFGNFYLKNDCAI